MAITKRTLVIILSVLLSIYFVRAFESRGHMPLEVEHRLQIKNDFLVDRHNSLDWAGYQELEQQLLTDLDAGIGDRSRTASQLNRHAEAGVNNPTQLTRNWNLSYRLEPTTLKGSAVLIHGLTDSPYSVRATAEIFAGAGFSTFAPRMPGHGFNVGSLASRDKDDWLGVVRLAVEAADAARLPGQPLILGGYSNGAILALRYAMECRANSLPCPDRILLMSPAIAVSGFAWFGHLHQIVSWMPYFAQFRWESIYPEVDSFKFTSFPKSAAFETASLAADVEDALSRPDLNLPPILAFQSVVDATVSAEGVLSFFEKLSGSGHELVFYDMNRYQYFTEWSIARLEDVHTFEQSAPLPITVSILSNQSADDEKVAVYQLRNGSLKYDITPTELAWPTTIYSLSHIAVPFPPDDPQYGENGSAVGTYSPRGEKNVISLGPGYFQRLRYNPFYKYQAEKITGWLNEAFTDNP